MKDLQRNQLKRAFKDYMPLPVTLEPHFKEALDRVLSNPGSLIRPQIVLNIALRYQLSEAAAMTFGESAIVSVFGAIVRLLLGTAILYALKSIPALHGYVDSRRVEMHDGRIREPLPY